MLMFTFFLFYFIKYLYLSLYSSQSGLTALLWAADMGHLEVVNLLLQVGADLHLVDVVSLKFIYISCGNVKMYIAFHAILLEAIY